MLFFVKMLIKMNSNKNIYMVKKISIEILSILVPLCFLLILKQDLLTSISIATIFFDVTFVYFFWQQKKQKLEFKAHFKQWLFLFGAFIFWSIIIGYLFLKETDLLVKHLLFAMAIILTPYFLYWLAYLIFAKSIKWEKIFLHIGGLFALIFMIVLPLGGVPDEQFHAMTSYTVMNEILGIKHLDNNHIQMRIEDDEYRCRNFSLLAYRDHDKYSAYLQEMSQPIRNQKLRQVEFTNHNFHKYLYVIPALGMSLARLVDLPYIYLFLCGRIANLIFYLLLVYLALKYCPKYKQSIVMTALLPMCLQQSMSLSYDVMINALTVWICSYTIQMQTDSWCFKKHKLNTLGTLLAIVFLALAKSHAYVLISLLPIFILLTFYFTKIKKIVKKLCLFFFALPFILFIFSLFIAKTGIIQQFTYTKTMISWNGTMDAVESYSIGYFLKYPLSIFRLFVVTLKTQSIEYIRTFVGGSLAWLDVKYSFWIVLLLFVIWLYFMLPKREDDIFDGDQKLIYFSQCLWTLFLILLGLAISWTPAVSPLILGVQGRYFIPVAFCLGLSLPSKRYWLDDINERLLSVVFILLSLYACFYIWLHF